MSLETFLARRPLKVLAAALAAGAALAIAGGAVTAETPPTADDVLLEARRVSMQLRTGRYDLSPRSVAALEAAVVAAPDDVRLWNALGTAYFQQVTASFQGGAVAEIPGLIRKATAAHARALELAPDDPEALSGHGTALAVASGFIARPDLGREGVAKINRAAQLAPNSTLVRLQRGFTNLGVSADIRDAQAAEADLKYLLAISDGNRAGDVLHVLLGDLYAEAGKADLARPQYLAAARTASTTQAMAQARLAALAEGPPPTAEIARLRQGLGRDCAMCHGS